MSTFTKGYDLGVRKAVADGKNNRKYVRERVFVCECMCDCDMWVR